MRTPREQILTLTEVAVIAATIEKVFVASETGSFMLFFQVCTPVDARDELALALLMRAMFVNGSGCRLASHLREGRLCFAFIRDAFLWLLCMFAFLIDGFFSLCRSQRSLDLLNSSLCLLGGDLVRQLALALRASSCNSSSSTNSTMGVFFISA